MTGPRGAALLGALALLSACAEFGALSPEPVPPAPPPPAPAPPPPRSAASLEMERFYARIEESLLARGLLRSDGGGLDTPYDAETLARNFLRLAFYQEYTATDRAQVQREERTRLRRWTVPVRLAVTSGASVDPAQASADRDRVEAFAARLSRVTGHPVARARRGANFHVLFLNEQEREVIGPRLRSLLPGLREQDAAQIEALSRSTYCVLLTADRESEGAITQAVAVIRAELPDALRLACIHEEVAQGLGLANDSPDARPSIFNDDDEFGRLTTMDEEMLSILYDPALRPGMTEAEAEGIVRRLARERLAPTS